MGKMIKPEIAVSFETIVHQRCFLHTQLPNRLEK